MTQNNYENLVPFRLTFYDFRTMKKALLVFISFLISSCGVHKVVPPIGHLISPNYELKIYGKIRIHTTYNDEECVIIYTELITDDSVKPMFEAIDKFKNNNCKKKWLIINSGGGKVRAAMMIGNKIKQENFNVQVMAYCASSCGLIFAAGNERAMTHASWLNSRESDYLGFHQLSTGSGKEKQCVTNFDNSIYRDVKNYLSQVLPLETATKFYEYLTSTDCKKIKKINVKDLVNMGLVNSRNRECKNCTRPDADRFFGIRVIENEKM